MITKKAEQSLSVGNFILVIVCGVLLRWAVALHSHSGQGISPMYGDYEAQRHWMEVTFNLPVGDWYKNTTDNDLLYWGLDYPPLTAYHSLFLGKVASLVNQSYVQLHTSRGLESAEHKLFMRTTVLLADILIFFLPCIYYFNVLSKKQPSYTPFQNDFLCLVFLYPGFILVDHGHFQYNCISLGFTVAALAFIFSEKILLSAFFYCLALNYKQMSLYHSLPFFVYMLRICCNQRSIIQAFTCLLKIGLVVIVTFALVWSPFLLNFNRFLDVVTRVFPVNRGIFEDKVGNFWCAFNVVYKIKVLWATDLTVRVAAIATILASIPSLLSLALYPSHKRFILSLINVSLSFFLFSYQVHEKSILLVALPVLLYAPYDILACSWFLVISTLSLQHLVVKDNLHTVFISLTVIFITYLLYNDHLIKRSKLNWFWYATIGISLGLGVIIFIGFVCISPPVKYPDLWPLLNAIYSCIHFLMFYIYFNFCQFKSDETNLHRTSKTGVTLKR